MNLPFSPTEFFSVFAAYNSDFTRLPVLTYTAGLMILALVMQSTPRRNRAAAALLGLLWVWNGAVYHLIYFSAINPAAIVFGVLFILQGGLFLDPALRRSSVTFGFERSPGGLLGLFFIAYALILYPLIGFLLGHRYPESPVFGMAPCPTTIFTLGLLMSARGRLPLRYLIVPVFWSVVGLGAALKLRVWEDLGLTAAGLTALMVVCVRNRNVIRGKREAVRA